MDLIEINGIRAQPSKGIVNFLEDARAAGVAKRPAILPIDTHLAGDDDFRTTSAFAQRLADDFFGMTEAVDWRSVDQRDSTIDGRLNGAN